VIVRVLEKNSQLAAIIVVNFVHFLETLHLGKGLPQQDEVAQRVPGSLRHQISLTFGTMKLVDRQPYAPAAFTTREIPGTHF